MEATELEAIDPVIPDARPQRVTQSRVVFLAVALLTITGGIVRFTRLGTQSFWEDEVVTIILLREHLWTMLRYGLPYNENSPPLYYLIGWVWARLFGFGPVALRSLSALFGTATIPIAYLAARRLAGHVAGLVAAALVAFSPILVWYSQEVRVYSLFVFLSAVSFLFFARTLTEYSRRDLAAWSLFSALTLTVHYFAIFAIVVEAAWLVLVIRRRRPLALAFAPVALVSLALAPLLEKQRSTGTAEFISDIRLGVRVEQLVQWFTIGNDRATAPLAAGAALLLAGIALAVVRGDRRRGRGGWPALLVGSGTVALALAPIVIGLDYFFFRNVIIAWVPLAVAAACGFASSRIGLILATAACVVFLFADVAVFAQPQLQRDDWRAVAALVTAVPGSAAIAVYPAWDTVPLSYYAPSLRPLAGGVRVMSLWFVGVSSPFSAWKAPSAVRLAIPAGYRLASSTVLQHFVLRRYVTTVPHSISARRVAAIVTGANGELVPHAAGVEKRT